jgi:hypothetical protein
MVSERTWTRSIESAICVGRVVRQVCWPHAIISALGHCMTTATDSLTAQVSCSHVALSFRPPPDYAYGQSDLGPQVAGPYDCLDFSPLGWDRVKFERIGRHFRGIGCFHIQALEDEGATALRNIFCIYQTTRRHTLQHRNLQVCAFHCSGHKT